MTGRQPDYRGDGAAAWINETKAGEKYISLKILNVISINLFKVKEKPKKEEKEIGGNSNSL